MRVSLVQYKVRAVLSECTLAPARSANQPARAPATTLFMYEIFVFFSVICRAGSPPLYSPARRWRGEISTPLPSAANCLIFSVISSPFDAGEHDELNSVRLRLANRRVRFACLRRRRVAAERELTAGQ